MIRQHLNRVLEVFQLRVSFLKDLNNSQQLFVVDFIVALCRDHLLREIDHQSSDIVDVLLRKHLTDYTVRGVTFN